MNKYLKLIITRGMIGIMIGLSMGYSVVLALTLINGSYTFDGGVLMYNYSLAVMVGFYMAAVTVVFDVEEWSLLKQTVIHGLLNFVYIMMAFVIGWAPSSMMLRILFVIAYVVAYIIVWIYFKSYWTKKAYELNENVKNLKVEI